MEKATSVQAYFDSKKEYKDALFLLRKTVLATQLEEHLKWNAPVYTFKNKNILGIAAFKNYVGLWFFQGGLLADKAKRLVNAQEGKTKALRQMRFESIDDIDVKLVTQYIEESIQNVKEGKEIKPQKKGAIEFPEQINEQLTSNAKFKANFNEFTTSKQREFCEYISNAKREATKLKRLKKVLDLVNKKKGLHDQYKNG